MKIVIVDDDPLVSASLKIILEQDKGFEVTGTYSSGKEIVEHVKAGERPELILMDIRMDDVNGLEAAKEILAVDNRVRIIFLTTFMDDEYISQALNVGASGYILKQDCASLPAAVRAVAGGQRVFGSKIVDKLPDLLNRSHNFDFAEYDITDREQEIIRLVADGLSNKEIADRMAFGEGTVRNMVSNILSKLELRDRTQLAVFYYQRIV